MYTTVKVYIIQGDNLGKIIYYRIGMWNHDYTLFINVMFCIIIYQHNMMLILKTTILFYDVSKIFSLITKY